MDANSQNIVGGQNVIRPQAEQREARGRPGSPTVLDASAVVVVA